MLGHRRCQRNSILDNSNTPLHSASSVGIRGRIENHAPQDIKRANKSLQALVHTGTSLTPQLCEPTHIAISAVSYHEYRSGAINICHSNSWSSHNAFQTSSFQIRSPGESPK